ncbi:nonsense-mediated mRNA decay protein 2 [Coccinella septempunctata]|uniref:nonsense-mediated mRNA decay protein 2 n=1 Tax=Coccinella septempunctata TaxID=41139 RepID=UPI001D07FFEF|nr:nonsense-mediated mRNA decay protein 2 [Coccinella septempunctata]XP_044765787.1 nonsense-mediated mRNA decay protein 2 [Coccinella septempunctata]XP_044765788.1 nonsense-mediated mRNA decay protein 2 [Coccinella septempunctata]
MKLSFIFELLLIFVFIAFAASAVIDKRGYHNRKTDVKKHAGRKSIDKRRQGSSGTNSNRYCSCNLKLCNCCREFNLPVVSLQGPGCASLQYLKGDRLAISMSFGERILTNTTISSRKPQPVCMPLPGGISKFCGRIYNIGRKGDDFQACLGLELRSLNNIEASLRVSCFKFGPKGLRVEPSQPLPVVEEEEDDDDDDDDEDEFDFDGDDDDEDEDDSENDVEAAEYGGFSVFDDDFIDQYFESESTGNKKKQPVKKQPPQITKAPYKKTTKAPVTKVQRRKPVKTKATPKPKPIRASVFTKRPSKVPTSASTTPIPLKTSSTMMTFSSTPSEITEKTNVLEDNAEPVPEQVTNSTEVSLIKNEINTETPDQIIVQNTMITTMKSFTEATNTDAATTTTLTPTTTSKQDDDDSIESSGSDENPIAEVVEDMLDESDEIVEKKNSTLKGSIKTAANSSAVAEESDDVSEILDGVVDTITGEDSEEDKAENDDDEDEDDDDDDDSLEDEDEEDEDRRRRRRKLELRKIGGRRSRDMWLDRLHW